MDELLKSLNESQTVWFAKLVLAAVNADGVLKLCELDVINKIFSKIKDSDIKMELVQLMETSEQIEVTPPENIKLLDLAEIYSQIIIILISDSDFAQEEKSFLKKLADLFGFTDGYYKELLDWGGKGCLWKQSMTKLLDNKYELDYFQVPYTELNEKQRIWYCEVLISIILIDGFVDEVEIELVELLVSMVENPMDRKKLVAYVKNKYSPPIGIPPDIPKSILKLIFLEAVHMAAINDSISITEINHIEEIAKDSGVSEDFITDCVNWHRVGIQWSKERQKIVKSPRQNPGFNINNN